MPTFTLPDRVVTDHGESPRDSGMPIGGHSQADVLYQELCAERRTNRMLREELGDVMLQLKRMEEQAADWRCRAKDQEAIADMATDCVRRLRGDEPLGVRKDFDLLASEAGS